MTSYTMPEDFNTSNYLDRPGQYHVIVTSVNTQPTKNDGTLIDGIQIQFSILAGTESSQAGKMHNEKVYNPKMDSRDGGKFARLKIGRLIRALCLRDSATGQLAESMRGQSVTIDWNSAVNKQMVVHMEQQADPKYFQISGAHAYKLDDEEVAAVPKHPKAFELWRTQMGAATGLVATPTSAPAPTAPPVAAPAPAAAAQEAFADLFK